MSQKEAEAEIVNGFEDLGGNWNEEQKQNLDEIPSDPKVEEIKDSDSEDNSYHSFEEPEHIKSKNELKEHLKTELSTNLEEAKMKEENDEATKNPVEADIKKAEECKMEGNELFKAQEFIEALDCYKRAINY